MKRRQFVKNTAAIAAGSVLAPYIMTGKQKLKLIPNDRIQSFEDDSIMIIVELFGGNDGLNTVVPAYNDYYYTLRKELSYPKDVLSRFENSDLYFNPNLVEGVNNGGMLQLFAEGRLAVIEGIGYENPNLSHFRSQDIWLSGINSSDNSQQLLEGWLGRYISSKLPGFPLEIPEHPIAIQLGGALSLLLKSEAGDMGIALTDPDKFYELGQGLTPVEGLRSGSSNFDKEYNFAYIIAKQAEIYSQAVKSAYDSGKDKVKVDYSDGFAQNFRLISSLIAGGLKTKIYYLSLSNFDTHAQQQSDFYSGQHPTLLRELSSAICEFMDDAVKQGFAERIAGMTISEFGRRAYDNGSRGTDHGASSMQFVFGHDNYVNGFYYREDGKPDLNDLDDGGNIKFQYDYRRTLADFLINWFGADDDEIQLVFGQKFQPMGVLNPRNVSVRDKLQNISGEFIIVYPNPSNGSAYLQFELKSASSVNIEIYNLLGFKQQTLFSGYLDAGIHRISISISQSGAYFASVNVSGQKYSKRFIVSGR